MQILHRALGCPGGRPTVAHVVDRCARCFAGTISLGCDAAGHRASRLLARAGWLEGDEQSLAARLDEELRRLRDVGPGTRRLIVERLKTSEHF